MRFNLLMLRALSVVEQYILVHRLKPKRLHLIYTHVHLKVFIQLLYNILLDVYFVSTLAATKIDLYLLHQGTCLFDINLNNRFIMFTYRKQYTIQT